MTTVAPLMIVDPHTVFPRLHDTMPAEQRWDTVECALEEWCLENGMDIDPTDTFLVGTRFIASVHSYVDFCLIRGESGWIRGVRIYHVNEPMTEVSLDWIQELSLRGIRHRYPRL